MTVVDMLVVGPSNISGIAMETEGGTRTFVRWAAGEAAKCTFAKATARNRAPLIPHIWA